MIGTKYGPASSGRPSWAANAPAGATRLGPMIAPAVAPHTTSPMAEARRLSGYMSAAAYRDSWFEALPNPMRNVPTSSSGSETPMTAIVATMAPTTPIA